VEERSGDIDGKHFKDPTWVLVDGRSVRSVARQTDLSLNTVKKYLKIDGRKCERKFDWPASKLKATTLNSELAQAFSG